MWDTKLGRFGINTTQLIEHWTMDGAERDIDGRFRTTDDILAVLGSQHDAPRAAPVPLQVRGAGEEDWTSLGVGGDGGGGRAS
jgi:hypothetical protein